MIKLYYSGAKSYNAPQINPLNSLGGYLSSTPIPNGENNSVFSDVSLLSIKNKTRECKLIVLKNELANISNVKIWSNYEIAIVAPSENNNGEIIFEGIPNYNSIPYYAKFGLYSESEPFLIGNMNVNQCFGIWVKRIASNQIQDSLKITIEHG